MVQGRQIWKTQRFTQSLGIVGVILIALGLIITVWRAYAIDLPYPYVLAKMVATGQPAYSREAQHRSFPEYVGYLPNNGETEIFYPPSTGVALLPLTLFSFPQFINVWFVLSMALLLAGGWQMSRVFAPHWPSEWRLLMLGILLSSSSVRWATFFMQLSPVILGLLLLFLAALARNQLRVAFVLALTALSLKLTLALPFIGLPLLKRQFRFTAALLALWVLINIVGFARAGGLEAFSEFREAVARIEQVYWPVNSANPHLASVPRTDLPYLFNGIHPNARLSRLLGQILTAAVILALIWAGVRAASVREEMDTMAVFLAPLTCLTLACTYHHHYDANLLLAPLLIYLFRYPTLGNIRGVKTFLLLMTLYAVLSPGYQLQVLVETTLGAKYVFLPKILGSLVVEAGLLTSLLTLYCYLRERGITYTHAVLNPYGPQEKRSASANREAVLLGERSHSIETEKNP